MYCIADVVKALARFAAMKPSKTISEAWKEDQRSQLLNVLLVMMSSRHQPQEQAEVHPSKDGDCAGVCKPRSDDTDKSVEAPRNTLIHQSQGMTACKTD